MFGDKTNAHAGNVKRTQTVHCLSVIDDFAFARRGETQNAFKCGGLTCAVRTDEPEYLTGFHRKREGVNGRARLTVREIGTDYVIDVATSASSRTSA